MLCFLYPWPRPAKWNWIRILGLSGVGAFTAWAPTLRDALARFGLGLRHFCRNLSAGSEVDGDMLYIFRRFLCLWWLAARPLRLCSNWLVVREVILVYNSCAWIAVRLAWRFFASSDDFSALVVVCRAVLEAAEGLTVDGSHIFALCEHNTHSALVSRLCHSAIRLAFIACWQFSTPFVANDGWIFDGAAHIGVSGLENMTVFAEAKLT